MLGELAITPDVFRESSFSDMVAAALVWERLREPVLNECIVRDLFDGAWFRRLMAPEAIFSPKAKELLKKIGRRLRKASKNGTVCPTDDATWCLEAIASATESPLDCVVTTRSTKQLHRMEPLVADAEVITAHEWWRGRSPSLRLRRTTEEYLAALDRLLLTSNIVRFIDPHLDPGKPRYGEFSQLLCPCHRDVVPVRVELHRVCYEGSGPGRTLLDSRELEHRFTETLKPQLSAVHAKVEVFIWDDFHDRYLISNLLGILVPNGFDIDCSVNNLTTWARLGRNDSEDVEREFDPTCKRHRLHHKFTLL